MSLDLKPLAVLLTLGGCGFTPLYGGDAGQAASTQLDAVNVANIPERPGQMLRESLETQLHRAGAPTVEHYTLGVSYNIAISSIGEQEDTATTRNRYTATASWTLAPIGSPDKPLATGTTTAQDALNVIDQQYFAADLENDTVNQQLADEIAGQITAQLAVWFRGHPGA